MATSSKGFWKTLPAALAVAVLYFLAGRVGLSVAAVHANVSFVWPASGLALAALLLGGYRMAFGVFVGAFAVNVLTDVPRSVALSIALGNTLEAMLGAFLLRRLIGFQNEMGRLKDVLGLVSLGGFLSTTVAATVGVTALAATGEAPWGDFASLWFEWWIGDMLGVAVFAPLLLAWSDFPRRTGRRSISFPIGEGILLFFLLLILTNCIFGGWIDSEVASRLYPYLLFPLFIWAALRFGMKGATAAIFAVSAASMWGTLHGKGHFTQGTNYEALLFLQLFLLVALLTTFVLAATIAERTRSESVKAEFASMVSHELRTPLSSIKAGIELVADGIDGPVTDSQRETLGIARNNVNRLTRLINNVLDYSKLESGTMDMIFEKTDVTQILTEVHDLVKPAVQGKGIELKREFPDAPFLAVCDADKIKQVLINLLDNATKFTDAGGTISLHLRRADHQVQISVEDTGIGIRPEDQEKIFEMFGQASGGRHRRGSGIGLAVCRLVVDSHRGRIDVSSAPGEGTRLTVVFPDSLPESSKTVTLTGHH